MGFFLKKLCRYICLGFLSSSLFKKKLYDRERGWGVLGWDLGFQLCVRDLAERVSCESNNK